MALQTTGGGRGGGGGSFEALRLSAAYIKRLDKLSALRMAEIKRTATNREEDNVDHGVSDEGKELTQEEYREDFDKFE
jgi:23S rRNA pseudoU1915 N3-methylase RlmH